MDNKIKISENILEIVDVFIKNNSKEDYYGTDTKLHFSEIHMIKFIKENQGLHITRIAEKMGITKGAVSQTIGRLDKKGFLIKKKSSENYSKLIMKLTDKGEIAYINHEQHKNIFFGLVEELLENEKQENINFLSIFLEKLNKEIQA